MVRTTIPRNSNKNSQETAEDKKFLNFCFFKSISNIFLIWHKFGSIYKTHKLKSDLWQKNFIQRGTFALIISVKCLGNGINSLKYYFFTHFFV